jgi:hypothetical protein
MLRALQDLAVGGKPVKEGATFNVAPDQVEMLVARGLATVVVEKAAPKKGK